MQSLGFGVGYRSEYYDEFFPSRPVGIDWVEVITENYMPSADGGWRHSIFTLEKLRQDLPVVLHGVSLSIGSADPLNPTYLRHWKSLVERIDPPWVSDHLCWTGVEGQNNHELLPLPYTEEAVNHVVAKLSQVQDAIRRPMLIENVSSYLAYRHSEMTEWEFITEITRRSGCGILLDVNNVYVSSRNHNLVAEDFLSGVPADKVVQFHMAGHTDKGTHCIDTHDESVRDEVWDLYRYAARRFPHASPMIERDDNFPPWSELSSEVDKLRRIWHEENAFAHPTRATETISIHP